MRYEKTYNGIKTVLEGEELERMLEQFQRYDPEKVKKRFETDDPTLAMQMTAFKVYFDLNKDAVIDPANINGRQSPDSRKSDLLYRVVLYLTMKCLYPTLDYGILFDGKPSAADEEMDWIAPGTYFANLSKTITQEGLYRSAMKELGKSTGDNPQNPTLN